MISSDFKVFKQPQIVVELHNKSLRRSVGQNRFNLGPVEGTETMWVFEKTIIEGLDLLDTFVSRQRYRNHYRTPLTNPLFTQEK